MSEMCISVMPFDTLACTCFLQLHTAIH